MAKTKNTYRPQPSEDGRYYYKAKNGKGYLNFKSPLPEEELVNYDQIAKAEFEALTYIEPHVPSARELSIKKINEEIAIRKRKLAATDYIVIKIAEATTKAKGDAIREEYAEEIAQRGDWRNEINVFEGQLEELEQQVDEVENEPQSEPVSEPEPNDELPTSNGEEPSESEEPVVDEEPIDLTLEGETNVEESIVEPTPDQEENQETESEPDPNTNENEGE